MCFATGQIDGFGFLFVFFKSDVKLSFPTTFVNLRQFFPPENSSQYTLEFTMRRLHFWMKQKEGDVSLSTG